MLEHKGSTPKNSVDDLKQINGIGDAVEECLHDAGIVSYHQLAKTSPKELAAILKNKCMVGYSAERIEALDWIGLARHLAKSQEQFQQDDQAEHNNSFHYASFNLKLSLTADKYVHNTQVTHVSSKKNARWPGWDTNKLWDFIVTMEKINTTSLPEEQPVAAPEPMSTETIPQGTRTAQVQPKPGVPLRGSLKIRAIQFQTSDGFALGGTIPKAQSFTANVRLDLSQVETNGDGTLYYDAQIKVRNKAGGQVISTTSQGQIAPTDPHIIQINVPPLPSGNHSLKALVSLRTQRQLASLKFQLPAFSEELGICVI